MMRMIMKAQKNQHVVVNLSIKLKNIQKELII